MKAATGSDVVEERDEAVEILNLFSTFDWELAGDVRRAVLATADAGRTCLAINLSSTRGDPAAVLELCDFLRGSQVRLRVHNAGIVGEVPLLFYLSAACRTAAPEANFELVLCSVEEMHSRMSLRSVGVVDDAIESLVARQRLQVLLSERYGLSMDGYGVRQLLLTAAEAEHFGLAEISDERVMRNCWGGGSDARAPEI